MKGVGVTERKPLTRSKIGVLMGGQSSEREVSLKTGEAVYRSLVRSGYDAVAIDVGPGLSHTLQEQAVDVAFLALHGPGGKALGGTGEACLAMLAGKSECTG